MTLISIAGLLSVAIIANAVVRSMSYNWTKIVGLEEEASKTQRTAVIGKIEMYFADEIAAEIKLSRGEINKIKADLDFYIK